MVLTAWLEYGWLRLRRMDYWNPNHVPTNAAAKVYRWVAPGAQTGAKLQKLDEKIGTDPFSVRYYHRDQIKRDTAYYADTPLSVNHAIMKGKPLRPDYDSRADNMPQIDYFTSGKEYATPASMGIKGKVGDAAAKGEGIPM